MTLTVKGGRMLIKNKSTVIRTIMVLTLATILLFQFADRADAKKIRFSIGFTTDQTLESPRASESWQYTEMGCAFWPVLYDQLWMMGPAPEYRALPALATRWETKDRQTWRFYLRKDAKFHDGKPVTARDVEFTFNYLPKNVPSYDVPDLTFESVTVIDDYTIEFKLAAVHGNPYPPIYWTPILPKHIWEPYKDDFSSFPNKKAIGSGPYKLREFKSKQYVWFEANKEYWGGAPAVDEMVFKAYGGQEALNLAAKKGEVQMMGYSGIRAVNLPEFKGDKNFKIIVSKGIGMIWLSFNLHKKSALQDLNVRKAIMHGTDLDKIIDLVYQGYAQKTDSFVYPEMDNYNPNLPKYEYSPAMAKQLLDNAGYVDKNNDGIRNDPKTGQNLVLELIVPSDWGTELKLATLMKEQLKEVGIEIDLKTLDLDTYYAFIYAPTEDKWDFAIGEEEPGPNGDWIWELSRSWGNGGEGWSQSYYDNPKFDEVLDSYLAATNPAKRNEYSFKMQQMISEDLPYGILLRPDIIDPVRIDKWQGYVQTMGGVITWINPWTMFHIKPRK
jgi:peptide/nickel transport system substrate-binding protein